MPNLRRRYDRHSQRLFISERLSVADQTREAAVEACLAELWAVLAEEIAALQFSSGEARRFARTELGRYAAHALMMPYPAFRAAAARARYDVDVLAARFRVSFEQAATRLTTLARPGQGGVPFFLLEVDQGGNILRRVGAQGFPHTRFGGGCPKLSIHAAFERPGEVLAELAEMPDGTRYMTIARAVDGALTAWRERPRRTALLLGCEWTFAADLAYADGLTGPRQDTPIVLTTGLACRLCERPGCALRAEPPITRPFDLDDAGHELAPFEFR